MNNRRLRFFRDPDGAPRAEGFDPQTQVLALFLESDLQDDTDLCHELLDRLTKVKDTRGGPEEFIGNSFAVDFGPGGVSLAGHTEGNDHRAIVAPADVEAAIREWLGFIEAPRL